MLQRRIHNLTLTERKHDLRRLIIFAVIHLCVNLTITLPRCLDVLPVLDVPVSRGKEYSQYEIFHTHCRRLELGTIYDCLEHAGKCSTPLAAIPVSAYAH